ncbi:hypothetical protein CF327_g3873 [Tilletia walkeri]|nr:hypothetical protein CF327_g3873 [Tilletia walkeri]
MSGTRIDPVPTRITASWRVMHIPELFAMIATHLEREMVDLVALSTVSTHIRLLTLPHMVRYLDVRVTRSDKICRFFEVNPTLIDHVDFLRIRQDDAYTKLRHRPRCEPTQHPVFKSPIQGKWNDVGKLLLLIEKRRKTPLPRIDLSMVATDSPYVNSNFRKLPKLRSRVCALRIMVDLDLSKYAALGDEHFKWMGMIGTYGPAWDAFPLVIEALSSSSLVHFEFDNSTFLNFDDGTCRVMPPSPQVWSSIIKHLARHVRELSIAFCLRDPFETGYQDVMGSDWPLLRKARIHYTNSDEGAEHPFINRFLASHAMNLESLSLDLTRNGPLNFGITFPSLRTLSLPRDMSYFSGAARASILSDFGDRHCFLIRDWSLVGTKLPEARSFIDHASRQSMLSQLRVLRASKEVAEHYVRSGATPAHLQLDAMKELDSLQLWRWLNAKALRKAAEAITCLDIELSAESLRDLNVQLGHVFSSAHFPNLQELVLCSTLKVFDVKHNAPEVAAEQLRQTLTALRSARRLRALRIEHTGAVYFRPGQDLSAVVSKCPQALEYVSWHVPSRNVTQYFRVVRKKSKAERLQRLPPSFRVKIRAEDGVWEQESDLRRAAVLFDHSGGGRPELRLS